MSDEIEEYPVYPYSVEIAGTQYEVLAPEGEPGYRVRLPDGQVTAYPAQSGEPSEANAAADIAFAIANPPAPVVPVPATVTRRQLFLALIAVNADLTRDALRALLPDEAARIEFDEALTFERTHPLVGSLADNLSLDADAIFIAAAVL